VLGIYICPVLANIKGGGVSVGFVDYVILKAILEERGGGNFNEIFLAVLSKPTFTHPG